MEASCLAASGATACCPLFHHLETCARHLRLEQRCNNRKDLQLKASCQPCKHHSTRRKYEPTHQWMPCGTIAAPPQSVEVATPPPPCVEVAALWPTYSRITVVIHHPWRATGPSTGMGRDRFSHEHWGAKIAPTSLAGEMANRVARARGWGPFSFSYITLFGLTLYIASPHSTDGERFQLLRYRS